MSEGTLSVCTCSPRASIFSHSSLQMSCSDMSIRYTVLYLVLPIWTTVFDSCAAWSDYFIDHTWFLAADMVSTISGVFSARVWESSPWRRTVFMRWSRQKILFHSSKALTVLFPWSVTDTILLREVGSRPYLLGLSSAGNTAVVKVFSTSLKSLPMKWLACSHQSTCLCSCKWLQSQGPDWVFLLRNLFFSLRLFGAHLGNCAVVWQDRFCWATVTSGTNI